MEIRKQPVIYYPWKFSFRIPHLGKVVDDAVLPPPSLKKVEGPSDAKCSFPPKWIPVSRCMSHWHKFSLTHAFSADATAPTRCFHRDASVKSSLQFDTPKPKFNCCFDQQFFFLLSHSLQSWNIVADVKCKAPTFSLSLFLLYTFVSRSLFNSKLFCELQHLWNFDLWRPGFKWKMNNCFVSEHHLIFCLL